MVTRRSLLVASSGLALGAVAGCSPLDVAPAPPGAGQGSSAPAPPSATPTAAAPTPTASPSTDPTPSASTDPTSSASPAQERAPRPRLDGTVAENLDVPWGIAFFSDGSALVGERDTGRLLRISPGGRSTTVGTVPGVVRPRGSGEGGLLGLALAPGDEDTLFAYLTTGSDDRVVRLSLAGGRVGRPRVVLPDIPTSVHHHGGQLLFAADGLLLVSTGDAEQPDLAQDRGSLAGKVLRIRPDGRAAPGNPFDNRTFSYGHRNVEGLAFDPAGRLWATEFGDKESDELNQIRPGRNYGWPEVEGRRGGRRFALPAAVWSPTSSCSPAGVAIARSTAFVGALQGRCLFAVPLAGGSAGQPRAYFAGDHGRIRSVAAAPDGSLWVTTSNTDGRVEPGPDDDKILRVRL